jgi:hypothetical protein
MLSAALGIIGSLGIASAQSRGKDFTQENVGAIVTTLREADARVFLLRLPVFREGRVVGSRMYGTLPMKDVELFAESLKVRLDPNANIIAVFDPSGSGCDPGSMQGAPATAIDLAKRLDVLLADIDSSRYQFLR